MDSLPTETLQRIFKHFECTIPQESWEQGFLNELVCPPPRDLIALSQVCRRFHDIARPLIYRTVAFQWREDNHDNFMDAFMRTLCNDPLLGHCIQDFHVDDWSPRIELKSLVQNLLASSKKLDERQRRWLQRWVSAERDWPNEDVLLIPLILAPRLQLLDCGKSTGRGSIGPYLSGRRDAEDHFFANIMSQDSDDNEDDESSVASDDSADEAMTNASNEQQDEDLRVPNTLVSDYPLAQLKDVRFRHDYGNGCESVSKIEGVLLHPGIESLRLFAFTWARDDVKRMKWSQIPSSLRSIRLKATVVDATGLKDILYRCTQLRHLHIVLASVHRMDSTDDGDGINLDKMGDVLRKYGRHLEVFDFDTLTFRGYFGLDGHIGSLDNLKSLRHLKISLEDLMEIRGGNEDGAVSLKGILPRELVSLHIRPCEYRGSPGATRKLLLDETFDALRRVEVEVSDSSDPEAQDLLVPGWDKSTRVDMINRYETEEGELRPKDIIIFSRTRTTETAGMAE